MKSRLVGTSEWRQDGSDWVFSALCSCSCRNGERTASHAHEGRAGPALQPHEHYTTGNGTGNIKSRKNYTLLATVPHHTQLKTRARGELSAVIMKCYDVMYCCRQFSGDAYISLLLNRVVQYSQDFFRVEIWTASLFVKVTHRGTSPANVVTATISAFINNITPVISAVDMRHYFCIGTNGETSFSLQLSRLKICRNMVTSGSVLYPTTSVLASSLCKSSRHRVTLTSGR